MTDREKVISHFQDAIEASGAGNRWRFVRVEMIEDAIALLREQEAVKPIKPRGSASWICGACRKAIGTSLIYHFCPWCGKAVKDD